MLAGVSWLVGAATVAIVVQRCGATVVQRPLARSGSGCAVAAGLTPESRRAAPGRYPSGAPRAPAPDWCPSVARITFPRMAVKEAMQSRKRPPHLRLGNARQRCGLCRYWRATNGSAAGSGVCTLYGNYPVRATQLCDSFAPRGKGGS